MNQVRRPELRHLAADAVAGLVVFFVALPLCLGVALASNAPLMAGLVAGVVGGLVVGSLSKSQTSVSGPAAGLTAVVAEQIARLGSFEAFLAAVSVAGVLQIGLGLLGAGSLAAFFPSSVVNGLLAAIGIILILKQIPHVLGHDADPEGDLAFQQPDHENTFSELLATIGDVQLGAAVIGLGSLALLYAWDHTPALKRRMIPAPLVVVVLGLVGSWVFAGWGGIWTVAESHLVQIPLAETWRDWRDNLRSPTLESFVRPEVYLAGLVICLVASLESLLNLQAVDKLDPLQRHSPPSRELCSQGIGNLLAGLGGGLPVTSVIVRSSVNINSGAKTQLSAILHGGLLLGCVVLLPGLLNQIPLSCLAAILLVTGVKLASPDVFRRMWARGWHQFLPFVATIVGIVLTDLIVGVVLGMVISLGFILHSNLRRPVHAVRERRVAGDVLHLELANQVSFLNRAALAEALRRVPAGSRVLIDAHESDYIDADILDLIDEYRVRTAPAHRIQVSLTGFQPETGLPDDLLGLDHVSRTTQHQLSPERILELLREGNRRFLTGQRLYRDLGRQIQATADGQFPLAVVLSCSDSRVPIELVFDHGLGDIFGIRIAGNVVRDKVLGSLEYACAIAGAKVIVVLGHTQCGAVAAAIDWLVRGQVPPDSGDCEALRFLLSQVAPAIEAAGGVASPSRPGGGGEREYVDLVARANVVRSVRAIEDGSPALRRLIVEGRLLIVGGMYDIGTGAVDLFPIGHLTGD